MQNKQEELTRLVRDALKAATPEHGVTITVQQIIVYMTPPEAKVVEFPRRM